MISFLLISCLLISGSVAIDFTTIGQKEIVDYIKNRADLLYGRKLNERNLQDLLSNAVFTGLEEEAILFAYGSSVNPVHEVAPSKTRLFTSVTDSTGSFPLKITLTSDSLGSTNIASGGLTTTKSTSSKSSVGEFFVNCLKENNSDSTILDGSINVNLGGATDSHNLTLIKTIYLSAEVNVTSLGSDWGPSSSSLLTNEGKLLSMLDSKDGSMFIVTYQSLIRDTIKVHDGDLFGGLKSSGKVLVVVNSDKIVSLSGRSISGKFETTWNNEGQELIDQFLAINGYKSVRFVANEMIKPKTLSGVLFGHRYGSSRNRDSHSEYDGRNSGSRRHHDRGDWEPSCHDGSTWPSWRNFFNFGYGYRYRWDNGNGNDNDFDFDFDPIFEDDWEPSRQERIPVRTTPKPIKTTRKPNVSPSTTPKPKTTTKRPVVTSSTTTTQRPVVTSSTTTTQRPIVTSSTTPKPVETVKPIVTIIKDEPEVEVTTIPIQSENHEQIVKPAEDPKEKLDLSEPDFSNLPKGTTISLWSTRIVQ